MPTFDYRISGLLHCNELDAPTGRSYRVLCHYQLPGAYVLQGTPARQHVRGNKPQLT